jgi:LmbE family N-acetylglucosaminyl deacetylase
VYKSAIRVPAGEKSHCILRYNGQVDWIYLSPHFDDAALSCGGLIWEQVHAGDPVSIWTVCAGEPPTASLSPFAQELHTRWQTGQSATAQRKKEDLSSCHFLGVGSRYFNILDCIYRRHPETAEFLYPSEAALNGTVQPGDAQMIAAVREDLRQSLPDGAILVCPLGIGKHVDHQLTRMAAEGLECSLWYYADYPYVEQYRSQVENLAQAGWGSQVFPVSPDGLAAWQDSIAAHGSQISTFWTNSGAMRSAITVYLGWYNGIRLWRKP